MGSQRGFQLAASTLCVCVLLFVFRYSHESCLSTSGSMFKGHPYAYLIAKPFYIADVWHSSECFVACESSRQCNAVNIRGENSNKKTCELLSGDSTTLKIHESNDSSFYEITQPSLINVAEVEKAVCQPECHYIPSCDSNSLDSCRCPSDTQIFAAMIRTMMSLAWGPVQVGSSSNSFATVKVNVPSGRFKLKLVSLGSFISCIDRLHMEYYNNFGCMKADGTNEIRMIVTDKNNTVLLPGSKGYSHDGKISKSIFVTFNDPINLEFGQDLRIWYKDDLENHSEADNFGLTYIRVLALRIE